MLLLKACCIFKLDHVNLYLCRSYYLKEIKEVFWNAIKTNMKRKILFIMFTGECQLDVLEFSSQVFILAFWSFIRVMISCSIWLIKWLDTKTLSIYQLYMAIIHWIIPKPNINELVSSFDVQHWSICICLYE